MIDHGRVRSDNSPKTIEVDEQSVWLATEIVEVSVQNEDEVRLEYEYNLVQYTKDEYIQRLISVNQDLETNITDTQLALCDVYEILANQ